MSPQKGPDGNLIPLESERVTEQHAHEDAEIETLLGGFCGKGYMVSIHRMQPRWCQGFLDTWPLDEAISMQDLRSEFGGRRFGLKVKRSDGTYVKTIPVWIDDEPKRDGRPIRLASNEFADRASPIIANPGGAPATTEILRYMQASNDRTLKLLGDMLTQQKLGPPGVGPDLAAQLGAFSQMMDLMGTMQERFGGAGGGGENASMMQMFMEMMRDRFKGNDREREREPERKSLPPKRRGPPQPLAPQFDPRPPAPPHYVPPLYQQTDPTAAATPPIPNPGAPPVQSAPPPDEGEEYDDPIPEDVAADLVDLGPQEAGRAIASYLDSVDQETATATIQSLFKRPPSLDKLKRAAVAFEDAPGDAAPDSGSDHQG